MAFFFFGVGNCNDIPVQRQPVQQIDLTYENGSAAGLNEAEVSQGAPNKQVLPPQVIELSDDDEIEELSSINQIHAEMLDSLIWYYRDPQGRVQGPFSVTSLKRWNDANYFPPDFKVWKTGQRSNECVLLIDILHQFFPG